MSAPTILRWEDPPPLAPNIAAAIASRRERPPRWQGVVTALQLRPGDFAVVYEAADKRRAGYIAWAIRSGAVRGFAPGEFEAGMRLTPDGCYAVYARYIGDDDDA